MIPQVLSKNRWLTGITTFLVISVLAFAMSFTIGNDKHGSMDIPASWVEAPSNMQQLVGEADIIVAGVVGSSVNETDIGPYDAGPATEAPLFPVTDYQVSVTSVLKGDGTIAPGDTVTLRQFGHLSEADTNPKVHQEFPMSKIGDSRLFALGKNPDNATYGLLFGPYSRFTIDGDVVEYSDMGGLEVKFARNVAPTDFIASIKEEIGR